jgi:Domain of Unknown Function with PDB structure (DUF3857)
VTLLPNLLSPRWIGGLILLGAFGLFPARCQEPVTPAAKPTQQPVESSEKQPELPAQIELLETRVRFEANGDSCKEVHTRVHINNELGARQFARLAFDYNRSFQQIEFPLIRVTHTGGGTADILPSAISDQPNPAAVNAPAYQDVRVKSVRILGLAPGDILEYRVITTTSHHPLAPDFWLDHTFDRSGVVSKEIFGITVPESLTLRLNVNPNTPFASSTHEGQGVEAKVVYVWKHERDAQDARPEKSESEGIDISLSTFKSWEQLADRLASVLMPADEEIRSMGEKAFSISKGIPDGETREYYDFVSQKIRTVDLPLGATGYQRRKPMEILESGYGTAEDKFVLFAAMGFTRAGFVTDSGRKPDMDIPSPSRFDYLLTYGHQVGMSYWLDLNAEVAPIGMIPARIREKTIFVVGERVREHWQTIRYQPVYPATQRVSVSATLAPDGALRAKAKYVMRGDNELLLRVAFHKTPRDKWNDVAQLLALSDGFRGKVTNVSASDPYDTKEAFTVEYEITQPKFVDWAKKPVRIPALLPQVGLPDPPAKTASGTATTAIDLGTPLDVETRLTLHLPEGTAARVPAGTSVERDYATFASTYGVSGSVVTAARHLKFLRREVSAERAADYNAFVRAVQGDEAQEITLEQSGVALKPPLPKEPGKRN